jgi:hypothetical protein
VPTIYGKIYQFDESFRRPGNDGIGGRLFSRLKMTQLSRPVGMDFIKIPAKKL